MLRFSLKRTGGLRAIIFSTVLIIIVLACGRVLDFTVVTSSFSGSISRIKSGNNKADRAAVSRMELTAGPSSISVPFVENSGQFPEQVRFQAPLPSGSLFLTEKSLVYSFCRTEPLRQSEQKHSGRSAKERSFLTPETFLSGTQSRLISFRELFVGENGRPVKFAAQGEEQTPTRVSYFRGKDPGAWKTALATYRTVSLGEIYPGVNLKLKAEAGNVEQIFLLEPGISPEKIRIKMEGVKSIAVDPEGRLVLTTDEGPICFSKPVAYQEVEGKRIEAEARFTVYAGNTYGFQVDSYDRSLPLVIDPTIDKLLASTFLGGNDDESYVHAEVNASGNIYVAGVTRSTDFPQAMGVSRLGPAYGSDRTFVAMISNDFSTLHAVAFLEGGICQALKIGASGDVYVAGWTGSASFPVTPGAYDTSFNNFFKGFVSRLDSSLSVLLASTYLGGDTWSFQSVYTIALDQSGNVYVAGETGSADFPVTPGAFQTVLVRTQEGFVSKLDPDLTTLLASTFLGGNGLDKISSIAFNGFSSIYAAGTTESRDFPVTPGALRTEFSDWEAFVTRLSSDLTTLEASTFLGGRGTDHGNALRLGPGGNVYVVGDTESSDFPVSPTAFKKKFRDQTVSETDGFISILAGDLGSLVSSTLLGGSADDECLNLTIDNSNRVYVVGTTSSADFPVTWGAYDMSYNGGVVDNFVARLDPTLSVLEGSTYLGGSDTETCASVFMDGQDKVIVAGTTLSSDFPVLPDAFDRTFGGTAEGFVSRLGFNEALLDMEVTVDTVPSGFLINVDGVSYTSPQTFHWTEGTVHTIGTPSLQGESPAGAGRISSRLRTLRTTGKLTPDKRPSPVQGQDGGTRYVFSSWSDDGAQYHEITVRSSTWRYTAFFDKQYSLNVSANPPEGGSVTPAGTNWFKEGAVVQVTADPNPGYGFSSWSGDISSRSRTVYVTMDGPKTLVANFIDEKVYPPVNVNIQRLENDLIFYKEYVNRLTWQPNELNKIMVLQYFIYVKPKGSSDDDYRLLARVFFDTFQYDHRNLKKDDLYTYRITSFNIQGKESSYVEISN